MLNGMMYIVRPLMQPGNSVWIFLSSSEGEIQFPSLPWTPSAASGIVVILFGVDMNVRDSTRATSFGSVRAKKQLSYFGSGMRTPASTSYRNIMSLVYHIYVCGSVMGPVTDSISFNMEGIGKLLWHLTQG